MRIGHRLQALITPGEGQLLAFVGRAGPDDADDGNEAVDLAHVAHAAEAGHGGRFDMMNRPRAAAGNHLPHLRIAPRLKRLQVHAHAALRQHGLDVAHGRQAALRQNVHLHQTDGFHGIHVKVRRGAAFVGDESGRQFMHGLAREHEAAGMHLGITRHAIEEFSHLQGGAERFFVQRQIAVFGTGPQHFNQAVAAAGGWFIRHPAAAETPREMVGEFPHFPFRHTQHFGHFRKGAAGLEGRKASHRRAMFAAVFLEDESAPPHP